MIRIFSAPFPRRTSFRRLSTVLNRQSSPQHGRTGLIRLSLAAVQLGMIEDGQSSLSFARHFSSTTRGPKSSLPNQRDLTATCTVTQLEGEDGKRLFEWLGGKEGDTGFICYRTCYDNCNLFESYKTWVSWAQDEEPGSVAFRLLFVNDELVLDGASRDRVRDIHHACVLPTMKTDTTNSTIAEWKNGYGSPEKNFFILANHEAINEYIQMQGYKFHTVILVAASWEPRKVPEHEADEDYNAPRDGLRKGRGYYKMHVLPFSPLLYKALEGQNAEKAFRQLPKKVDPHFLSNMWAGRLAAL